MDDVDVGIGPFDSPPVGSYWLPFDTLPSRSLLTILKLFSSGSKSVSARPPAHPFDWDTMTTTALEAIASSSGKNWRICSDSLSSGNCHRIPVGRAECFWNEQLQTLRDIQGASMRANRRAAADYRMGLSPRPR